MGEADCIIRSLIHCKKLEVDLNQETVTSVALWIHLGPGSSDGFRGGKGGGANAPPLWRRVMYFCVHNCTSPSNDYAGVACSNNNQA